MKYKIIGLLILLIGIVACNRAENPAQERARYIEKSKGDVIIGVAAPWSSLEDKLWNGIEMARREINSSGGVLGRKIRIIKGDDEASVTKGLVVTQQFVENKDLVAVLGHYNSYVSISVSIIYQYYGILMLSPMSTSPKLTDRGFGLIFRNIPSDAAFGKKLADFSKKMGYKSMVIYHANDEYGKGLANAFEMQAEKDGIQILDRISYDSLSTPRQFRKDLSYWKKNYYFDAIFLAGVTPQVAQFIREARDLGIMVPIVGGDGLDSPELLQIVGEERGNDIYVGSVFNPESSKEKVRKFVQKFKKIYGIIPDAAAAQGYDALMVLAYAIKRAGSTVPGKIADALHSIKNWKGVTENHTFNERGDVVDKAIVIKIVEKGKFRYPNTEDLVE
jgi:branched-chain amino acid transport system substrate-binding protein